MGRLLWRLRGERFLFRTHKPAFQTPEWAPGQLVECGGVPYRITRWEERARVPLARGGSVPEWEVWGRPADPAELRAAAVEAAERILHDS